MVSPGKMHTLVNKIYYIKFFYDIPDGIRIGSNNTIESLMENDFRLIINDAEYLVQPPLHDKHTMVSRF